MAVALPASRAVRFSIRHYLSELFELLLTAGILVTATFFTPRRISTTSVALVLMCLNACMYARVRAEVEEAMRESDLAFEADGVSAKQDGSAAALSRGDAVYVPLGNGAA